MQPLKFEKVMTVAMAAVWGRTGSAMILNKSAGSEQIL